MLLFFFFSPFSIPYFFFLVFCFTILYVLFSVPIPDYSIKRFCSVMRSPSILSITQPFSLLTAASVKLFKYGLCYNPDMPDKSLQIHSAFLEKGTTGYTRMCVFVCLSVCVSLPHSISYLFRFHRYSMQLEKLLRHIQIGILAKQQHTGR